jgi:hypothetical protein
MPRITIEIDPVGKLKVEGHDFLDSSCKSTLKPLEQALFGNKGAESTNDKPEAHIPATGGQQQLNLGM